MPTWWVSEGGRESRNSPILTYCGGPSGPPTGERAKILGISPERRRVAETSWRAGSLDPFRRVFRRGLGAIFSEFLAAYNRTAESVRDLCENQKQGMPSRLTIFRIAAVIILLLTGVELIACEVVSPATCEMSGAPGDQSTNSGDACLCCCFHIVVGTPLVFEPTDEVVVSESLQPFPLFSRESTSIYHPPRA